MQDYQPRPQKVTCTRHVVMADQMDDDADPQFLPGFPRAEDYSKALLRHVMLANKSTNDLPKEGDDFDYYSSFPGFQMFCSKMSSRVQRSIGKILQHQQLPWYQPMGEGEKDESYEALVEANDVLLERVSTLLDEASGVLLHQTPILPSGVQHGTAEVASWNKTKVSSESTGNYRFIHSKNIQRPQLKFKDQPDNDSSVFIPRLREKPNAQQPLPQVFKLLQPPTSLNALISNAREWAASNAAQESQQQLLQPYQFELEHFEPLEEQLQLTEPRPPASLEDTPLTYVESLGQLQQLKQELCSVAEFAIDLEHHSYRTFQGFVCLMQISTPSQDYLIDTLLVREHMNILLDPFTNPKIVKVLHGADWDIKWLQRDFGLYVVNLFDTGQASRVLGLPRFSLAFLLEYCCSIQADKKYQLADWRIRPLPTEMAKYAREDTHYLLYIYHRMRNELLRRGNKQQNLLRSVLDRSRDVALQRYTKPAFLEDGYLRLYHKHKKSFSSQQLYCLKLLYAWRDHAAREADESMGFVLPNHMMFQISEILPREAQGVLACCNPIPTLLRQQLQEVYMLVQNARDATPQQLLAAMSGTAVATVAASASSSGPEEQATPQQRTQQHSRTAVTDCRPSVEVTGPPVPSGKPVNTALQKTKQPELASDALEQLRRVLLTFPEIVSMFIEAKPGIPSPPVADSAPTPPPPKRARLEAASPQAEATPTIATATIATATIATPPSSDPPQHEYVPPSKRTKKEKKATQQQGNFHSFDYSSSSFSDYSRSASQGKAEQDSFSPSLQEPSSKKTARKRRA